MTDNSHQLAFCYLEAGRQKTSLLIVEFCQMPDFELHELSPYLYFKRNRTRLRCVIQNTVVFDPWRVTANNGSRQSRHPPGFPPRMTVGDGSALQELTHGALKRLRRGPGQRQLKFRSRIPFVIPPFCKSVVKHVYSIIRQTQTGVCRKTGNYFAVITRTGMSSFLLRGLKRIGAWQTRFFWIQGVPFVESFPL